MKFSEIKKYTAWGNYAADIHLYHVERTLKAYTDDYGLDMNPDFQRAHVWNDEKRSRYIEHLLRGGKSGRDFLFNCPGFRFGKPGQMVLVDGKQRLEAIRKFHDNEIKAFGCYFKDFEDANMYNLEYTVRFHVNDLPTRADVLQWYLDLNSGGVVHTEAELEKVRRLLEKERETNS